MMIFDDSYEFSHEDSHDKTDQFTFPKRCDDEYVKHLKIMISMMIVLMIVEIIL